MKEPMSKGNKPAAKIKVSQSTIDSIKKMGMTKALAGAKSANPEMKEALTRMYGARRVSAASTPAKAAPRGAMVDMGGAKKAASRTGTPFGQAGSAKSASSIKKKSTTTDPFAKAVFAAGKVVTGGSGSNPKGPKEAAYRAEQAKKVAAARKAEAARRASTKK